MYLRACWANLTDLDNVQTIYQHDLNSKLAEFGVRTWKLLGHLEDEELKDILQMLKLAPQRQLSKLGKYCS